MRSYKDDVYSLGLIVLEIALLGGQQETNLPDISLLHKEEGEHNLRAVLKDIKERGYSNELIDCIFNTLRFEDADRVDFEGLEKLIQEKLGKERYRNLLEH